MVSQENSWATVLNLLFEIIKLISMYFLFMRLGIFSSTIFCVVFTEKYKRKDFLIV